LDVIEDYLKETLDLGRDDVFKVDVKEGFSFFNTSDQSIQIMEVLNVQLEGRRINVEISKVAEDVIITEEVLVVVWWRKF
jgi:ATP-dependent RNA helicase DeaD